MPVLDRIRGTIDKALLPDELKIPDPIERKINRARERIKPLATKRNECFEFWRGNQYAYVDDKNQLRFLPTTSTLAGGGKAPWRVRKVRNLILNIVAHEVSAATSRVPSYEVVPTKDDATAWNAASLSERIALYGYDKWRLKDATTKAVTLAIVGDESFAWPFFDTSIGPFIRGSDVGIGEVAVRIFGPNECFWEPGLRFEESSYHVIEQARDPEKVQELPGYEGGELEPDAQSKAESRKGKEQSQARLVMVTEYLEKPCPKYPDGRWMVMANGRLIQPVQPYPSDTGDCPLHKLQYFIDPDSDRDMGLVRHCLDPQRSYNDHGNLLEEWTKRTLNPQSMGPPGLLRKVKLTAEPGAHFEIGNPELLKWRETPPVPVNELSALMDRAQGDMARIAAQNDIPSQVESGKGIMARIERDQVRARSFIASLAEWHSSVMRACLALVQQHYTEDRLIQFRGNFGWESIEGFRGASLRDQIDIRVSPASLEAYSKQEIERRVMTFASYGWVTPEKAMAAIEGGYGESLIRSYDLDVAKVNRVIQRIKQGPEALFSMPEQVVGIHPATLPDGMPNPDAGKPQMAPGWMPRESDNEAVWKSQLEDWMKTEDFERQPPPMQEAANQVYTQLLQIEQDKAARAAALQVQTAEQLGMRNAARGPSVNGLPEPQNQLQLPSMSPQAITGAIQGGTPPGSA